MVIVSKHETITALKPADDLDQNFGGLHLGEEVYS